jgi:hypothetical protein
MNLMVATQTVLFSRFTCQRKKTSTKIKKSAWKTFWRNNQRFKIYKLINPKM